MEPIEGMLGKMVPDFEVVKANIALVDHDGNMLHEPCNFFQVPIRDAVAASLRDAGCDACRRFTVSYWDFEEASFEEASWRSLHGWSRLTMRQTYEQAKNEKGLVRLKIRLDTKKWDVLGNGAARCRDALEQLCRAVRAHVHLCMRSQGAGQGSDVLAAHRAYCP